MLVLISRTIYVVIVFSFQPLFSGAFSFVLSGKVFKKGNNEMNKFILLTCVGIWSFEMICESRATDLTPTSGTCNTEGTCLWNLSSDGTLNIYSAPNSKNVAMDQYTCNDATNIGNRPWEQHIQNIKNIVVGDNITNISNNAFQNALNLETVKGMKDVKILGVDSFAYDNKLTLVEMPSVEEIYNYALSFSSIKSVDLPNIKKIVHGFGRNIEYIGLPDWEVKMVDTDFSNTVIPNCSNENRAACGSCGNDYVKSGIGCVSDCGDGYLGKEGRCVSAENGCGENYRQIDTWCNRIRYTPAEAAEILKDEGNNVILTFRK